MREIGVTCSGQRGADDSKTLAQAKFQIGDFLDINISPANRKPEPRQERRDMGRDRRPYWSWHALVWIFNQISVYDSKSYTGDVLSVKLRFK